MENLIFGVIGFIVGYVGAGLTVYLESKLLLRKSKNVLIKTEKMMQLIEDLKGIHEDIKNLNKKPNDIL